MRLLAIDGDGISSEILAATLRVLNALDLGLALERAELVELALERDGVTFGDDLIARAKAADGVILGPVSHLDYPPAEAGGLNPSGVLRRALDLYANIRPARAYDGVPRPIVQAIDVVVVRENTEGFYADRTMHVGTGELMPTPDLALAFRKITRSGSRRIAEAAFALAVEKGAPLAAIHKQNVLRVSDGLFLEEVRAVAAAHPAVPYEEVLIDAAAAHLVREPTRFGVILATNMYGDILSDLTSELAGGLGLGGSINHGADHGMAQAQHGSAPDIAGRDLANPTSLILSAAMLLDWLAVRRERPKLADAARRVENAVIRCVAAPETRTRDLGGALGTRAYADAVLARL